MFVLAVVAAGDASPKSAGVTIDKAEPARLERTYVYGHLPPDMVERLKLKDEAGVCDYLFGMQVLFGLEQPRFAFKNLTATITSIKIQLTLRSTIWLSDRADGRVRAHEDAHRVICETFYREADSVARKLAEARLGTKVTVPKSMGNDRLKSELEKVEQLMLDEFKRTITDRCALAEDRFDTITDHSRKDIANDTAVAQALVEARPPPAS